MRRILFAVSASLLLAGCESATAPAPSLSPSAASHDEIIANPECRSGWSVANGRCI